MRTIKIPELKFSNWMKWDERDGYELKYFPGVYIISVTNKVLSEKYPSWNDVVYIGMTISVGGLASRWRQFDRSINGKFGHSGGNSVYEDLGTYKKWRRSLYVGAMGIECNVEEPSEEDYIKMGWVAFFEYEAFSQYFNEMGKHPKYNKQ
jgi:hypothetical protein